MATKRNFINELAGDRGVAVKDMDKFIDGLVKSRWDGKNWVSNEPKKAGRAQRRAERRGVA